MKAVYITGCLGFIGSYITSMCLELGWYVKGVDKITYAANSSLLDKFKKFKKFIFEQKDINDLPFLSDCDYVINCAAESHVDNSIIKSDDFIHSNIRGVHNLLELIRKNNRFKMPTFIHFSTDEVYGDTIDSAHKETDILKPSNPYSATKASADMLILAWARTYKVPYIIVRPSNNYGIGQYVEKLIPKTCKFLIMNRKIPLHEMGSPKRIWLHAKDTARAIITIIDKNCENTIYNISGDFEQPNIDTVTQIIQLYFRGEVSNIQDFLDLKFKRPGHDFRYLIDDSRIRALGWNPLIKFNEELPAIVEYYKNNFIW